MKTLIDLFRTFNERGDKVAFVHLTGVRRFIYSYKDFYTNSLKMCAWLADRGISRGDRVALWAPNSPWWAVAFFGTVLRGAIVVPVDFISGKERAEQIIKLTDCKIIIQGEYKLDKFDRPDAIFIEDLQYILGAARPTNEIIDFNEDEVVELMYTSGTTGDPKGVELTHKNLISNLLQVNEHIPIITEKYNFLSVLPLSHMFEQTGGFLTPLLKGSEIVYLRTLKPSAIMDALKNEDIYVIIAVPRLLQALKHSIERELDRKILIRHFNSLVRWGIRKKFGKHFHLFISGGAALEKTTGKFWQNLGFLVIEGYGLTECSPILAGGNEKMQKLGSAGKPLPGVQIKIENGEILAKGSNVFSGYWRQPEKTKEVFTSDGWFMTGDFGEFDSDGWLYIKGRKKDTIVTGAGINIYPDDIERILNQTEGVKESCVIGRPTNEGEEVHAVLILNDGARKPEQIIAQANNKLDSEQQINNFSLWPEREFPKTATLKIQKFKVAQYLKEAPLREKFSASPDTLISLIGKVTDKSPSAIKESSVLATDLGLTSVARLELVNYVEQEFRLDLEDTLIDQNTTVGKLRDIIQKNERYITKGRLRFWPNTWWGKIFRRILDVVINYPIFRLSAKLEVKGLENLQKVNAPVLFISNHVSYFDQPAIMFSLPRKWRYRTATAAWEEFFFEGGNWLMLLWRRIAFEYGTIGLNLFPISKNRGFRKTLVFMGKLADHKLNTLIFPEGIRPRDGKMLPFKDGLGMIVKELQVPVIPIKIKGMEKVYPRGTAIPKHGVVEVIFGKPLFFKQETPSEILKKSRMAVEEL